MSLFLDVLRFDDFLRLQNVRWIFVSLRAQCILSGHDYELVLGINVLDGLLILNYRFTAL